MTPRRGEICEHAGGIAYRGPYDPENDDSFDIDRGTLVLVIRHDSDRGNEHVMDTVVARSMADVLLNGAVCHVWTSDLRAIPKTT